ncbi:MAG: SUF system NifU family Fe-S cluster assembly protein [Nitrososphaerota archaeon]
MSENFPKGVLDHYRKPRNYGEMKDADITVKGSNKLCGDYVEFYLKFDGNKISAISFKGQGCMISQASASMLTELVKGKEIEEALRLTKHELLKMLGLELGPVRIKCATLPLETLKKGIESYLSKG